MAKRTFKQQLLGWFYPVLMRVTKKNSNRGRVLINENGIQPPTSIYTLAVPLNDGSTLALHSLKGRKLLLVNTASNCGYTQQYSELQQLSNRYAGQLVVIGFPANDFMEQENGSDQQIAQFCTRNFGVQFPLAQKSSVVKSNQQNPVFNWLSSSDQNGWNNQQPDWNFSKYLVDESGVLTHYFGPSVSPLDRQVADAIAVKRPQYHQG